MKFGMNVMGYVINVYLYYICCMLVFVVFILYFCIGRVGRGNIFCVRLFFSYWCKCFFNVSVCYVIWFFRYLVNDVVVVFYGCRFNFFSCNSSVLYFSYVLLIFFVRKNLGCVKFVFGVFLCGCGYFFFICS